jgi:hypothetical protein
MNLILPSIPSNLKVELFLMNSIAVFCPGTSTGVVVPGGVVVGGVVVLAGVVAQLMLVKARVTDSVVAINMPVIFFICLTFSLILVIFSNH